MKILLIGASAHVGQELQQLLTAEATVVPLARTRNTLNLNKPDIRIIQVTVFESNIISTDAYTEL